MLETEAVRVRRVLAIGRVSNWMENATHNPSRDPAHWVDKGVAFGSSYQSSETNANGSVGHRSIADLLTSAWVESGVRRGSARPPDLPARLNIFESIPFQLNPQRVTNPTVT